MSFDQWHFGSFCPWMHIWTHADTRQLQKKIAYCFECLRIIWFYTKSIYYLFCRHSLSLFLPLSLSSLSLHSHGYYLMQIMFLNIIHSCTTAYAYAFTYFWKTSYYSLLLFFFYILCIGIDTFYIYSFSKEKFVVAGATAVADTVMLGTGKFSVSTQLSSLYIVWTYIWKLLMIVENTFNWLFLKGQLVWLLFGSFRFSIECIRLYS